MKLEPNAGCTISNNMRRKILFSHQIGNRETFRAGKGERMSRRTGNVQMYMYNWARKSTAATVEAVKVMKPPKADFVLRSSLGLPKASIFRNIPSVFKIRQ